MARINELEQASSITEADVLIFDTPSGTRKMTYQDYLNMFNGTYSSKQDFLALQNAFNTVSEKLTEILQDAPVSHDTFLEVANELNAIKNTQSTLSSSVDTLKNTTIPAIQQAASALEQRVDNLSSATSDQADWNENDNTKSSFIKNKPNVILQNEISDWAKASNKPSYRLDELTNYSQNLNSFIANNETITTMQSDISNKVTSVPNKGLSECDFTFEDKNRLDTLSVGALIQNGATKDLFQTFVTEDGKRLVKFKDPSLYLGQENMFNGMTDEEKAEVLRAILVPTVEWCEANGGGVDFKMAKGEASNDSSINANTIEDIANGFEYPYYEIPAHAFNETYFFGKSYQNAMSYYLNIAQENAKANKTYNPFSNTFGVSNMSGKFYDSDEEIQGVAAFTIGAKNKNNMSFGFIEGLNNEGKGLFNHISGMINQTWLSIPVMYGKEDIPATFSNISGYNNRVSGAFNEIHGANNKVYSNFAFVNGANNVINGSVDYSGIFYPESNTTGYSFVGGSNNRSMNDFDFIYGREIRGYENHYNPQIIFGYAPYVDDDTVFAIADSSTYDERNLIEINNEGHLYLNAQYCDIDSDTLFAIAKNNTWGNVFEIKENGTIYVNGSEFSGGGGSSSGPTFSLSGTTLTITTN